MTMQKELSNELNLTRLAARIIRENLDKSPIAIGNLIVREFHSQGIVKAKFGFYSDLMEPLIKEVSNGEGN